jgi:SAM-dependent methyltransferase
VGKHNKGTSERVTFSGSSRFAKHLIKSLSRNTNISRPLKILDFGGADGSLALAVALKMNNGSGETRITVVDFGSELANPPNARIQLIKRSSLPELESFDLIIASSSLEMQPNFGEVLQKLLNALSQQGVLYVRTNFILPFLTPFNLGQFSFPAHLHDIGPDFWEHFAANRKRSYSVAMSGTSISEVNFRGFPMRFILTSLLKLPARLESSLFPRKLKKLYKFVGSWEVLVTRTSTDSK